MKRTLLTIAAIALTLGSIGCGGGNKSYANPDDAAKASESGWYTKNDDGRYEPLSIALVLALGGLAVANRSKFAATK